MREMVHTGYMHNYMRMYWGKKILEWSNTPEHAYRTTLYLNNKFFLDGRDPNSFANVAWVFGQHDRGWTEREVFGKVRFMSAGGLERKAKPDQYVEKVEKRIGASDERGSRGNGIVTLSRGCRRNLRTVEGPGQVRTSLHLSTLNRMLSGYRAFLAASIQGRTTSRCSETHRLAPASGAPSSLIADSRPSICPSVSSSASMNA
jgi:hypothetical protein